MIVYLILTFVAILIFFNLINQEYEKLIENVLIFIFLGLISLFFKFIFKCIKKEYPDEK